MDLLFTFAPVFIFLILGYIVGSIVEKNHYKSIYAREAKLIDLPVLTIKRIPTDKIVRETFLVQGSVVISLDYFKRFLASMKNLIGGRLGTYESLLDRARREAILRLKENATGADIIYNLKLESCAIGKSANSKKQIGSIEVFAYGTAVKYSKV
ncbi:MAG: hypothetical protein COB02_01835 [Candidatus Cloacimonadota bacterium]|nr:MAG: hypothetical protein COB02_01835 [Candidatus Cloacimonadota bacterium]